MAMTRPRPKVMTLTDAAAERVKAIMVKASKPALALRLRNLVWLSRVLLVVLLTIVFMMTVKLGT